MGQYGHVWVEFTPNEEGKGFEFENAIVGGVVPREYIPAVEKGLEDSMNNGVLLVIHWLISKQNFTMVHTTMSIQMKRPSV